MSQQNREEQIIHHIERLLYLLRNRQSSNPAPVRPTIRPILTWDEQTRHLRFAQKVKLHRYPGGLANTTRWRRDQMLAIYHTQLEVLTASEKMEAEAVHEAMAYALDAERFLGSLDQRDDRDYFPVDAVDALAEHLLVWLGERGYQVSPIPED